jgi:pyridinium-3,5-bisthiocarboxylic acid mononucleotide nickel chelatase
MPTLYLDCSSGIAGDMTVAALLGVWADRIGTREAAFERLVEALRALPYRGYRLRLEIVERSYIVCNRFVVEVTEPQPERHYTEIRETVERSALPESVKRRSIGLFLRIAEVEARMHGIGLEEVHFHEIGAVDSILDIVGTAWLLEQLGVQDLVAGSIVAGRGRISTEHGLLPIPAPATLELLRGVPLEEPASEGELITPTGAAILTLCSRFGPMPAGRVVGIGYGAGSRIHAGVPGFLRAALLEDDSPAGLLHDSVEVLETSLDDLSPQAATPLAEALFEAGALDVFFTPVLMKKGRPAFQLTALCPPDRAASVLRQVFLNSSTLGVRHRRVQRSVLERRQVELETEYGPVEGKEARFEDRIVVQPEYEACLRLARERGVPFLDVWRSALAAAQAR